MKKSISILVFIISITNTLCCIGQVGIGTVDVHNSAILELKSTNQGVLIPQVALLNLTDTNAVPGISSSEDSLLVFNTATNDNVYPGYYYWYDNSWTRFVTGGDESIKCSNTDYKDGPAGKRTQLSVVAGIKAPLMGNTEWNDDIFLYDANEDNREITVLRSGTYQIEFSVLYNIAKSGHALSGQIQIDGIPVGSISATGYIDGKSSDNENASIVSLQTFDLNKNDKISLLLKRNTNKNGNIYLQSIGTSTITITNLK